MRRSWLLLAGIAVACARANAPPKTTTSKATHAPAKGRDAIIATTGGVVDSEGAKLSVPAGAVKSESTYSITRVTGADLEGWPQGTTVGFVFEPAGQQFRIPVLVELPNDGVRAEAMCQTVSGDRTNVPADAAEEDHYHF